MNTRQRMHIYIYIGSITWPHFSLFWVNNLATVESITWPPSKKTCLIVFVECAIFRVGAKLFFGKVVLCQNWCFQKMASPFFGGVGRGGDC